MPVSVWFRSVVLLFLLGVVLGCGYHLSTVPSGRFGDARSIWIPFFTNESVSPTAQTVLRRAFYDELHALRGLHPASSEEAADLSMKARVVTYGSKVVSYNALDQAREFSLSLNTELEIVKKGQPVPFWKGQLQAAKQYPANRDLALQRNSEEQALDAVARILAHKFISAVEESY